MDDNARALAVRLAEIGAECERELERANRAPTSPIGRLYRVEVTRLWLDATDRAIAALQDWRQRLAGGGLVSREDLAHGLELLDTAGLSEWAEWGAGLDLDGL